VPRRRQTRRTHLVERILPCVVLAIMVYVNIFFPIRMDAKVRHSMVRTLPPVACSRCLFACKQVVRFNQLWRVRAPGLMK
jgi:hypothetical protein